nr:FAD-dependent oxidoreductase [Psychrobacter sp. JCM 18903]
MTTSDFDLHIIGGGIIGLAAAVTLQARGVKVALLDATKLVKEHHLVTQVISLLSKYSPLQMPACCVMYQPC